MHTTANTGLLIRSEIWSNQLKERIVDNLSARSYVNWMTDFPDGDTFTIPSIGQATVRDYVENEPVVFDALDTGEFQFSITEYKQTGVYITDKLKQDAFYSAQLESKFVPEMERAIMERLETDIFALQGSQTSADLNTINGGDHRWVAQGATGPSANAMQLIDFARALYSFKKANITTNLVAVVDPSVEYTINTLTNLVNVSNNPMWDGIISTGIASDARFVKNIYGFDVYTSNYLANGISETVNSQAITSGVANMFFSVKSDILPFVGAWRETPNVESYRNVHKKRDEYVITCRYGLKLYRPENLVVVLSKQAVT